MNSGHKLIVDALIFNLNTYGASSVRKHLNRILIGLGLTVLFAIQVTGLFHVKFIGQLDNLIYDARLKLTMPGGIDNRIVILDVDEKSLANPDLGRWPWSRDKMARIMDRLFEDYQIKQLGFDVIWAEPDNSSGLRTLQSLAKTTLKGDESFSAAINKIAPKLDYDKTFAKSLEDRPVVLGYYFNSNEDATQIGALPDPLFFKDDLVNRQQDFSYRKGYGANLAKLAIAAPTAGHFNPTVDTDGVIRRVPLIAKYEDDYYESLALAMFRLSKAIDHPDHQRKGHLPDRFPGAVLLPDASLAKKDLLPIEAIEIGNTTIPVGTGTNTLVPFRGKQHSFEYISLADVYTGATPKDRLTGKIVLVGTTAPGLADLRATPVGGLYPGVEVHANLIAGMLDADQGAIKSIPPFLIAAELILIVVTGIVLSLLIATQSAFTSLLIFLATTVLVLLSNFYFWHIGFAMPLAALLILVSLIYIANIGYGYFVESRHKRQLADLFGQYVPPELVDKMAENPLQYSMAARKTRLTVLFADIVGFTSISEKLSPQELTAFVNEYLTEMSAIIRHHGGTLDKYIGDAIMAFWGAPVDDQAHATSGVVSALAMQNKLSELKKSYEERGWPKIAVGLGLSTGDMTVGDMGSNIRKAYTVMGDAVNLGSRLEGITRQYGVGILVSEETQKESKGIIYRDIDMVRVKGKDNPITIFEPVDLESDINPQTRSQVDQWNILIQHYRAQKWDEAETILRTLLASDPDRKLYQVYAERITLFRQAPPPSNWDGVTKFETK